MAEWGRNAIGSVGRVEAIKDVEDESRHAFPNRLPA